MARRYAAFVLVFGLHVPALTAVPAAAQSPLSPMERWLAEMARIEAALRSIPHVRYCKPPGTPLIETDQARLAQLEKDIEVAQEALRSIQRAFRQLLPPGHRLLTDDPRLKTYPPILNVGTIVDIMAEGTTPGDYGGPYFAAASQKIRNALANHAASKGALAQKRPESCVEAEPGGGTNTAPPVVDVMAGLKEPEYVKVTPPSVAPCYPDMGAKRDPYNRAHQAEQRANWNVNMADWYVQAIRNRQVFYRNRNAPIQDLQEALNAAEIKRTALKSEWDAAYARINEINAAPIPCPKSSQPPPVNPAGRRTTILGGVGFGSGAKAPATPLGAGPSMPVPGNRTTVTVPTFLVHPGKALLNDVIDLLDEADWLDYSGYFDEAERLDYEAWDILMGLRMSFTFEQMVAAEPRLRPYIEAGLAYKKQVAQIRRLLDNAESVRDILQNSLLRANSTSFVSLRTSEAGGYMAGLQFGGGVEFDLRRELAGFASTLRTGVVVEVPLGSPREQTFSLDYGFTAGGVSFQQTDEATFTTSLGTSWGARAGLTLSRPVSGGMTWSIDVDLDARHRSSTVAISTNPSTTSSQPGVIVFATPAGTRTIVISTIPGVPSTVSTAVTNQEIAKSSGWTFNPAVRFGITF